MVLLVTDLDKALILGEDWFRAHKPKMDWEKVEKILVKYLVSKGIPTYVYPCYLLFISWIFLQFLLETLVKIKIKIKSRALI